MVRLPAWYPQAGGRRRRRRPPAELGAAVKTQSELERAFAGLWRMLAGGASAPKLEHRFYEGRKWAFDFAWPAERVAVEVEGGVWTAGRHTRGAGFIEDCAKYNAATCKGWAILRYTGDDLKKRGAQVIAEVVGLLEARR